MDCVIDLETTGFPLMKGYNDWYRPSELGAYDSARFIEIGSILLQPGRVVAERSFLIRPDHWTITNSHIHGITEEMASTGQAIAEVLPIVLQDLQ